ncbi:MAG: hypothetical protein AAGH72_08495 [Verrucomicrobiota bacterium]
MRSAVAGFFCGVLFGASPLLAAEVLSLKALWTLGLGLGMTYLSIGLLVGYLPWFGPFTAVAHHRGAGMLFGLCIGCLYSLPGGFFTMAPYPLAADAPAYWREFSDGGWRAFGLTLFSGAITGMICGIFRKKHGESEKTETA